MMTRSYPRPTAPATTIATTIAARTTRTFRSIRSLTVHPAREPRTDTARNAPRVMKTPWPKLRTSIRPNTKVRPEAMMKMIIPIASPANVSVTQVENEPVSGIARSASAGTSSSGIRSALIPGRASGEVVAEELMGAPSSLVGSERKAQQALLQAVVLGKRGHRARMHDAAPVHHRHLVAELPREVEVLLDQEDGRVGLLELPEGGDHVLDDGRRQALARLVDQQEVARLDGASK